jgi:hypothetical protein
VDQGGGVDLGGRNTGVQPERHGGVPQLVRAAGQGESTRSGGSPYARASAQTRPYVVEPTIRSGRRRQLGVEEPLGAGYSEASAGSEPQADQYDERNL